MEVWVLDLVGSRTAIERAYTLLSEDERERSAKFRFPADRDRFILARAGLRQILAGYHEMDPAQIAFGYSEYGKPSLRTPPTDLKFNASHSAEKGLVACTRGMDVGVDLECIGRDLDVDDLADRFFSAQEIERLSALPAEIRHLAFLRCWTCKEAYIKVIGKGLSIGLDQFDVSAVLKNPAAVTSQQNEEFVLGDFLLVAFGTDAIEGYRAAMIVKGSGSPISTLVRRFQRPE